MKISINGTHSCKINIIPQYDDNSTRTSSILAETLIHNLQPDTLLSLVDYLSGHLKQVNVNSVVKALHAKEDTAVIVYDTNGNITVYNQNILGGGQMVEDEDDEEMELLDENIFFDNPNGEDENIDD